MNEAIQKNVIRTRIKHERLNLTSPFMQRSAIAILGHIDHSQLIQQNQNIAFYLPVAGEISCMPLIEYALEHGKNCFVPKVFPNKKLGMWFLPYTGKDSVQQGSYNILEPTSAISKAIRPSELDVIFMPLVAFDASGNRLGMGGGYYDATLSSIKTEDRPQLVGLAYNLQEVRHIPQQSWDVRLDAVVTPSSFRRFHQH